jgi:hypothetical protein
MRSTKNRPAIDALDMPAIDYWINWFANTNPRLSHLVQRLRFWSYDHLFVTDTANSIPLFSGRCTDKMSDGNSRAAYMRVQEKEAVFNINPGNQGSLIIFCSWTPAVIVLM